MLNLKKRINEIKDNLQIEYQKITSKTFKALPVLIICSLLVVALVQSGKEYEVLKSDNQQIKRQSRSENEKTLKSLQEVRSEFKSFRDEATRSGQEKDAQIKSLDEKIEGIKVSRKAEQARLAVVQPSRSAPVQRFYASGDCEQYRGLVSQYAWNVNVALAVMKAESGCNNMAANWGDHHETCMGSFGLMQIACMDGQVYDPSANVAIAWRKYQASGWSPWGVCNSGKVHCI